MTTTALQLVHVAAAGIPRRLNLLASRLLLHAFAEAKHELALDDALSVLQEMEDEAVGSWRSRVNELRRVELQQLRSDAHVSASAAPAQTASATAEPPPEASRPGPEPATSTEVTEPLQEEAGDDADLVINGPADAPGRYRADHAGPRGPVRRPGERGGHHRAAPRMRSAAVIVSVTVALVAVTMVVVAATPVGESLEARIQTWVESLRTGDSSASSGARSGPSYSMPAVKTSAG